MVDVSVSAPQTPLIEPEETPISLTIQLSEPPPPGGLRVPFNVSIDSGAAKPLAQFNLNSFSFDNASLAQLPNTDTLKLSPDKRLRSIYKLEMMTLRKEPITLRFRSRKVQTSILPQVGGPLP